MDNSAIDQDDVALNLHISQFPVFEIPFEIDLTAFLYTTTDNTSKN